MTLDLIARRSRGQSLPGDGREEEASGAVIMSAEDGIADTIRPRLEAAGADLERVAVLSAVRDREGRARPPSLPDDLEALRYSIRQTEARLVVVDPLMAYLNSRIDSHRDQDIRGSLHQLARLAEDTGVALVCIRHLNKTSGSHPLYQGGGSIGIIGAVRAGLLVAPDPKDETRRVLAMSKSNLGPIPPSLAYRIVPVGDTSRVEWEGEVDCSAKALLAVQREDGAPAGPGEEAESFLREVLADGPAPARDVQRQAKEVGISYATLRRAKDRLEVHATKLGGRFGGDPAWYWELKVLISAEDAHPEKVSAFRESEHLQGAGAAEDVFEPTADGEVKA